MKHESMKLTSSYNNQLYIKVMNGHFATNHSHINQYIDMTTLKVRGTMAAAAAKSMGTEYMASTIVDTIVCMDGTEVIGAYLAETLSQNGITSMNQHKSIYVVTPEVHSSGQLIFRDNLQPMIEKAESPISQARATPARNFSEQMAKAKSFERGESNGNRRNILQAYEARQDAVTETIKVIAIKKERGFQTTRTNRLKSAIGF